MEEEQGRPAAMDKNAEIPEEKDNTKTSHKEEAWQPGSGSDEDSAESMTHRATLQEEEGELGMTGQDEPWPRTSRGGSG